MDSGGAGAGECGERHWWVDHHAGAMLGDDEEELAMIGQGGSADDGGGVVGGGDPGDGAIELISAIGERSSQQGRSAMLARSGQLRQADGQKGDGSTSISLMIISAAGQCSSFDY